MPKANITYDIADFGLEAVDLQAKYLAYSKEHPEYTEAKWQKLLSQHPEAEEQFRGYWDWVVMMIAADNEDMPEAGHAQAVTITESDMVSMDSMDQFAAAIAGWHQNKVAVLRHMQTIPEGTEMEVTLGDKAKTLKLEGDVLTAFKTGLELALIEFGNLPFAITTEDIPDDADAADPSQG